MTRSPFLLLLFALLWATLSPISSLAIDYYVDGTNGDNANGGLIAEDAWKTITHAISATNPSRATPATINLANGIYGPSTNGEIYPIVLRSYHNLIGEGPECTVLDGEWMGGIIDCASMSINVIENMCIRRSHREPAIHFSGGNVTIRNCVLVDNRGSSTVSGDYNGAKYGDLVIEDCTIDSNVNEKNCLSVDGLIIRRSVITGNTATAILETANYLSLNDTLLEGNQGTQVCSSACNMDRCVMRGNEGQYTFFLRPRYNVIRNSVIENNTARKSVFCLYSSYYFIHSSISTLHLENNLIAGNVMGDGILIETAEVSDVRRSSLRQFDAADEGDDERIVIRRCTITNNRGGSRAGYEGSTLNEDVSSKTGGWCRVRLQDSIFRENAIWLDRHQEVHGSWEGEWYDWPYEIDHSCLQDEFEGDGNFIADPLFVSGPMGDYYLSAIDAGQEADSPCIDAGSTSASIIGMNTLTTRTDDEFDADTVDIGYHYSATPPTIDCEASDGSDAQAEMQDARPFRPGDTLRASITVENGGTPQWVDIYAGFIMPDGTLLCLTPDGLTTSLAPYLPSMLLSQALDPTSIDILQFEISEFVPTGTYTFAAALSLTASFRPIGDISTTTFQIE
ncbi:DUF1565 domain-containing protein [bacterium]|nr:DUF1565 domain-containing protein [bacterium]